jgi:broad specificity phosphatase PhoE
MPLPPDVHPEFFFLRHGETEANDLQLMAGSGWDVPLNERGRQQAEDFAAKHAGLLAKVKTVCVSPLTRAQQTAEIVNRALQKPQHQVDDLKEWFCGDWERQPYGNVPGLFAKPHIDPPNGEPVADFFDRCVRGVHTALQQGGPVLIVAHGGVWHGLCVKFGFATGWLDNCGLVHVARHEGRWQKSYLTQAFTEDDHSDIRTVADAANAARLRQAQR